MLRDQRAASGGLGTVVHFCREQIRCLTVTDTHNRLFPAGELGKAVNLGASEVLC